MPIPMPIKGQPYIHVGVKMVGGTQIIYGYCFPTWQQATKALADVMTHLEPDWPYEVKIWHGGGL